MQSGEGAKRGRRPKEKGTQTVAEMAPTVNAVLNKPSPASVSNMEVLQSETVSDPILYSNDLIYLDYLDGYSVHELVKKYGLNILQVRDIVNKMAESDPGESSIAIRKRMEAACRRVMKTCEEADMSQAAMMTSYLKASEMLGELNRVDAVVPEGMTIIVNGVTMPKVDVDGEITRLEKENRSTGSGEQDGVHPG